MQSDNKNSAQFFHHANNNLEQVLAQDSLTVDNFFGCFRRETQQIVHRHNENLMPREQFQQYVGALLQIPRVYANMTYGDVLSAALTYTKAKFMGHEDYRFAGELGDIVNTLKPINPNTNTRRLLIIDSLASLELVMLARKYANIHRRNSCISKYPFIVRQLLGSGKAQNIIRQNIIILHENCRNFRRKEWGDQHHLLCDELDNLQASFETIKNKDPSLKNSDKLISDTLINCQSIIMEHIDADWHSIIDSVTQDYFDEPFEENQTFSDGLKDIICNSLKAMYPGPNNIAPNN